MLSQLKAYFQPGAALLSAWWNDVPCADFANQEVQKANDWVARYEFNPRQAAIYFNQLSELTWSYGGSECQSIVARSRP